jgi:hypothetical protein
MKTGINRNPEIKEGILMFSTDVSPAIKTNKAARPLINIEKYLIKFI